MIHRTILKMISKQSLNIFTHLIDICYTLREQDDLNYTRSGGE